MDVQLSNYLWPKAINTATCLTTHSPSKSNVGLALEHVYTHKSPQLGHLKVFGCLAYIHVSNMKGSKLDP
jgi:hypothetical protein